MNKKMREACLAVADVFEFAPECWTSWEQARDENGYGIYASVPEAVQWCAVGGVMAALEIQDVFPVCIALMPFARKLGYDYAADVNNFGGRLVAIKMLRLAGGES